MIYIPTSQLVSSSSYEVYKGRLLFFHFMHKNRFRSLQVKLLFWDLFPPRTGNNIKKVKFKTLSVIITIFYLKYHLLRFKTIVFNDDEIFWKCGHNSSISLLFPLLKKIWIPDSDLRIEKEKNKPDIKLYYMFHTVLSGS